MVVVVVVGTAEEEARWWIKRSPHPAAIVWMVKSWGMKNLVLETSRLEPSRDLCSSMLGSRHPWAPRLELGKTLPRVAKIFQYA